MNKLFFISLLALSSATLACDHEYSVTGTDANGNSVDGVVCSNNGDRDISGYVNGTNGEQINITGQWERYGVVEATTDSGLGMELETN